jgi:hypothetical protein
MRSLFDYNDKFADGDASGLAGQTANLSVGKGGGGDDQVPSPTRAYLTISQVRDNASFLATPSLAFEVVQANEKQAALEKQRSGNMM